MLHQDLQNHSANLTECAWCQGMQAYKLLCSWYFLAALLLITWNGDIQIQMVADYNTYRNVE